MWGHIKFAYEALNQTAPYWIALNQTMHSQTKACITKSSYEICALLVYYTAQSGNFLMMFWDNLSVPASNIKKSRHQSMTYINQQPFFFFGEFINCLIF